MADGYSATGRVSAADVNLPEGPALARSQARSPALQAWLDSEPHAEIRQIGRWTYLVASAMAAWSTCPRGMAGESGEVVGPVGRREGYSSRTYGASGGGTPRPSCVSRMFGNCCQRFVVR
jgi:hypothetical protein